jgi:hypothetical protein
MLETAKTGILKWTVTPVCYKKNYEFNIVFVFHGTHNIKNSHQVDNNNQQLTIVGIHAKIEICLIIYNNIIIIYIIEVSMIIPLLLLE